MTTFDSRLVRRSELGALGAQDDWGRSWVRLTENAQVLLPADTTYQYHEFIQNFILSHSPRSVWEIALANFSKTCQDRARYLDIYSGDRLYVLERDTSIPVLASLSGILRTHYLGLTERARSYAQSRSLDSLNLVISLSHHTPKLKPLSDSTIRLSFKTSQTLRLRFTVPTYIGAGH
ncbi:hypothetical protein BT96DRAFT_116703 [Gymnopus androsaceus JB14]|uniref:Uncharacterized protein n=1 Tax=Gymnopus androsaceus JB14 TaxID=1447944 RepID=A0A6A4HEZ5_9AGAR|nr:hypothetical protein BT96DRAFT_116703 [Gymnopus androsaceus JB14]